MNRGRSAALAVAVLMLVGGAVTLLTRTADAAPTSPSVTQTNEITALTLDGVVDPFTASYITDGIAQGRSHHDAAVLITIDTPGGLDSSMRQITQAILGAGIPVICYTAPAGARAASAGTFIMFACPVNAMAPGTNIGAAHPVGVSGVIEQTKVTNDAVAYIRSLAETTGRNATWAEQAVRSSVSISAEEAVRIHVADLVMPSQQALLEAVNGRTVTLGDGRTVTLRTLGATVRALRMSWGPAFLHGLIDPSLVFIFFFLGLILIVVELLHPGISVPGVVGTVLLVTSVISFGLLPVRLGGVILLIASAVFFLFELKHPGLGLPTVGGTVCLVLGGLLLFNPAVPGVAVSPWVIGVMAAFASVFFSIVVKAGLEARHRPITAGAEGLIGTTGVALTDLTPNGTVRVAKETWTATSSAPARAGQAVRVTDVRGVHVEVQPIAGGVDPLPADTGEGSPGRERARAEGGIQ
jgi:membrane-bound serine protease (ClpP class)